MTQDWVVPTTENVLNRAVFNDQGLIPVIAQEEKLQRGIDAGVDESRRSRINAARRTGDVFLALSLGALAQR